ncbi:hypothetical protein M885DRAFT_537510 [Pelagophyceae sp. CCMP2097]|nr:hypothetical protein M885DRAFT_537510 [Pelagophyceae sp. CCMP2097]
MASLSDFESVVLRSRNRAADAEKRSLALEDALEARVERIGALERQLAAQCSSTAALSQKTRHDEQALVELRHAKANADQRATAAADEANALRRAEKAGLAAMVVAAAALARLDERSAARAAEIERAALSFQRRAADGVSCSSDVAGAKRNLRVLKTENNALRRAARSSERAARRDDEAAALESARGDAAARHARRVVAAARETVQRMRRAIDEERRGAYLRDHRAENDRLLREMGQREAVHRVVIEVEPAWRLVQRPRRSKRDHRAEAAFRQVASAGVLTFSLLEATTV